ncbi:stage III sporulation protein AG [Alkaliphilus hydrothermalis]|uniref:Stage III sporulation protein AG n=1 Tax=Alkaliphilus hydrothermalis TaxID=1482730 RepID=A0ABS2NM94_9FIRM|nr:stage III sporulation protein AG [Alkaliphilus hydrothermalis]MBM7614001.1 stage III sporulation protein AG [Alkaliphilus hydrothermalis]
MEKWNEELKKLLSKKYVANLLVILAVAVMALIVSGDFFAKDSSTNRLERNPMGDTLVMQQVETKSEEELVENRLKKILEEMRGAGEVEVMVTFEMGAEIVPAINTVESKDTTEEKDSNGGTRTVNSENITTSTVITNDNAGNRPLVLKEIKPQVKGVIVVAEGADDPQVKARLYEAVKTVLQIPGHQVQVYPRN